jgi:glycosyltransferase involved in cell wall biosynthesis
MKIVIPILGFGNAGGYRVISKLADEWINQGNDVIILVNETYTNGPYFPTKAKIIYLDKKGEQTELRKNKKIPKKQGVRGVYSNLMVLKKGMDILKSADIVLANHSLTTYPVYFSKIIAKKCYYIQAYEPEYYELLGGSKNKILAFLSRRSYKFPLVKIVNSEIYLRFKEIRADFCVHPGIDLTVFYPNKKQLDNNKRLVLGCIGRIEPYKGTLYVLNAFKRLKSFYPDVELNVAFGDKSFSASTAGVNIIVPKNDNQLMEFYNSVDILIAPGTVQLGAVHYPVLEAMACKIPVITTGYCPADDSNSWIVKVKDVDSIVNQVKNINNNPEERIQKLSNAFNDVQGFDWRLIAEKFNSILKTILNE